MKKMLSADEPESVVGGTDENERPSLPYLEMTTNTLFCWDCHSKSGAYAREGHGTPCPCCGSTRTVILPK